MRRDRILPDDPDFVDRVLPYMAGEIDASHAIHQPVIIKGESEPVGDDISVRLYGLHSPESNGDQVLKKKVGGRPVEFDIPAGSVNAFHTQNTPYVYGHEYRHKNYPDLPESQNRVVDLVAAQSDHDVDTALRMYASAMRTGNPPSEHLPDVYKTLDKLKYNQYSSKKAREVIEAETGGDVKDAVNESATAKFLDDVIGLQDWEEGLAERNAARAAGEPESFADTIRMLMEKAGY